MNIDMDKRSFIRNLCNWTVSFSLPISGGSILLGAGKKTSVNNGELVTLIENQNVMFAGTGNGDHARIFVENDALRKYVGYDSEDGKTKQFVLDDEECQKILDYKTVSTVEKHLKKKVVMKHEKDIIMRYARKMKLNDYDKIQVLSKHCGMSF